MAGSCSPLLLWPDLHGPSPLLLKVLSGGFPTSPLEPHMLTEPGTGPGASQPTTFPTLALLPHKVGKLRRREAVALHGKIGTCRAQR